MFGLGDQDENNIAAASFDLQAEIARIYTINEKWWRDIKTGEPIARDDGELFALMASELSEALEGERKNLDDDKLPAFKMAGVEMVDFTVRILDFVGRREIPIFDAVDICRERFPWVNVTPDSNRGDLIWKMHVRLAWCSDASRKMQGTHFSFLIADARLYCETFGYPFLEAYEAKVRYNETRADHSHEARMLADGKKF